jgi:hypothetical protein
MEDAPRSTGLLTKAFAALVLLVAAWILLKIVIGFVSAIFWTVLTIAAVLAVIWAYFTLRR